MVDKGIYSQKLKQKIAIIVAISMIIGGILMIAGCVLTGGLLPLIIVLAGATFFLLMESAFLPYDNSTIFEWLRDSFYKESSWLAEESAKPPLKTPYLWDADDINDGSR